jgi:hypothetical protein
MGISLLLLALVSCAAGALRRELLLTLVGAIPLAVSVYCFLAALCLSPFYRKRVETLSARTVPSELNPGEGGAVFCARNAGEKPSARLRPPGILIRYRLELHTADGRRIQHTFDPDYRGKLPQGAASFPFPAPERGAYYGEADKLFIMDILGLFRVSFAVPQDRGERLLVLPAASEEPVSLILHAGGHERRQREPHIQRTDDLTGHRPYVPGDDPRRINWKLYGHAGGLFIREGEPEPPPHSRLAILLDTEVDPLLYTALYGGATQGRRGVDILCEQALALAQEYISRDIDILVGYTGGDIRGGGIAELASALARPAAIPLPASTNFPDPPEDWGVLILALPRRSDETALDRFLKKQGGKMEIAVLFLYEGEGLDDAAGMTARYYNRRGGHARSVRV